MSSDIVITALDTAGVTLLALNDRAAGYAAVILPANGKTWRRITTTSPFVDGTHEVQSVLDGVILDVQVRVRGTTWAQVEARRALLEDTVCASPQWQLRVSKAGVTEQWLCDRPDISSPTPASDLALLQRVVSLQVPAQPVPTVTGV